MDDVKASVLAMLSGNSVENDIRTLINQCFIEDHIKGQIATPRDGPHASDFTSPFRGVNRLCYRKFVLNKNFKQNIVQGQYIDVSVLRIFKHGWYVHVMIQRLLREAGHAIEIEKTKVHQKYGIYYTTDAILEFKDLSKQQYILEIKSMNENAFNKAVEAPDARIGHPSGYKQSQIYMHLTNVDKAILLCFNKNRATFFFWVIEKDDEFLKPYVERMENLLVFYDIFETQKRLPKRVCEKVDDARAINCPMRDACWAAIVEREQYRRTQPLSFEQQNRSLIHEDRIIIDEDKN